VYTQLNLVLYVPTYNLVGTSSSTPASCGYLSLEVLNLVCSNVKCLQVEFLVDLLEHTNLVLVLNLVDLKSNSAHPAHKVLNLVLNVVRVIQPYVYSV
jgi:hypothetical protein